MKRRAALKNIGLSVGFVVAAPPLLSLLQQCKAAGTAWDPLYFSPEQGEVVRNLVDLILPTTAATPGALDVNVPQFIDLYVNETYDETQKENYAKQLNALMAELTSTQQVGDLQPEAYDALLKKYLKATAAERAAFDENEKLVYRSLNGLRDRSIWAYRTSQKIGEEVLAYDPVPGKQIGCGDLQELTGGKRWSL